mgnify:CR=1 FL=1
MKKVFETKFNLIYSLLITNLLFKSFSVCLNLKINNENISNIDNAKCVGFTY